MDLDFADLMAVSDEIGSMYTRIILIPVGAYLIGIHAKTSFLKGSSMETLIELPVDCTGVKKDSSG